MTTATCTNPNCVERDVAKRMDVILGPDEEVFCGGCGQPTVLAEES